MKLSKQKLRGWLIKIIAILIVLFLLLAGFSFLLF